MLAQSTQKISRKNIAVNMQTKYSTKRIFQHEIKVTGTLITIITREKFFVSRQLHSSGKK